MPHREALVVRLVVGPFEDGAAPRFGLNSQVLAVPLREFLVIAGGLEKHTADSRDLRHESSSELSPGPCLRVAKVVSGCPRDRTASRTVRSGRPVSPLRR